MPRDTGPLNRLRKELERIATFDRPKLVKRPEWGTISLSEAQPDFDRIYAIADHLAVLPLELLTMDAQNRIGNRFGEINNLFESIQKFSIEAQNPGGQRTQFVAQVQQQADALYNDAAQWIPFLAYQKGDVARNIESLTTSVRDAQSMINEARNDIAEKSAEIEQIITKAREASAGAGAAIFTREFLNEATSLTKQSTTWLVVTAALGVFTLLIALVLWYFTEPGLDSGQVWQKITTKIVVLGVMATATIWCGRIYKALMHQSTVNRHRALSIQTIQAFAAAAKDPQIKDAVVLEAARSIFGVAQTGYIEGASGGDGDMKIFEIARSVVPGEGK